MREWPITFSDPSIRSIRKGIKTRTRRLVRMASLYVDLPSKVVSDTVFLDEPPRIQAKPGRHRARLCDAGAVILHKLSLGVKPGEFHFRCPMVIGTTHLGDYADGKKYWTITPVGPQRLWITQAFSRDALTVYPCPKAWYRSDFSKLELPAKGEHSRGCNAAVDGKRYADCFACALDGAQIRWIPARYMPRSLSRDTVTVSQVRLQRLQDITEQEALEEGVASRAEFFRLWDELQGDRDLPARDARMSAANPWVWEYIFTRGG